MSSKTKTTQQQTEKADPWAPAIPYLTDALGTAKGLFDKNRALTPEQQAANAKGTEIASTRLDNPIYGDINTAASGLLKGGFAPKVSPVEAPSGVFANLQRQGPITTTPGALAATGRIDPAQAITKALSGQVDNPQLSAMADAATRQGQRTYSDAVSDSADSLTRSVLPSIRGGANLSGGYGGTRQGIVEGLAIAEREKTLGRGARDLGIAGTDAASGLFGNAYESAQNRMAGTADSLDARNINVGAQNADIGLRNNEQELARAQFEAQQQRDQTDIGFRNNEQELARAGMEAGQATQGAGLFGAGAGLQDQNIQQLLDSLGYSADWENEQFGPYAGVLGAIGGMGKQSTGTGTSTGTSSDPWGTASKLAQAAATAYASDERIKTVHKTVGYDAAGHRWVDYNYLWDEPGAPVRRGVIAQEVQKITPEAVSVHPMGFLVVDYGTIGGPDGPA